MKYAVAGIVLLIGTGSAALCQDRMPASGNGIVHPGTALLDSMGIIAGAPEVTGNDDSRAKLSTATVVASPDSNTRKQE
jgi:hypothetical protein